MARCSLLWGFVRLLPVEILQISCDTVVHTTSKWRVASRLPWKLNVLPSRMASKQRNEQLSPGKCRFCGSSADNYQVEVGRVTDTDTTHELYADGSKTTNVKTNYGVLSFKAAFCDACHLKWKAIKVHPRVGSSLGCLAVPGCAVAVVVAFILGAVIDNANPAKGGWLWGGMGLAFVIVTGGLWLFGWRGKRIERAAALASWPDGVPMPEPNNVLHDCPLLDALNPLREAGHGELLVVSKNGERTWVKSSVQNASPTLTTVGERDRFLEDGPYLCEGCGWKFESDGDMLICKDCGTRHHWTEIRDQTRLQG